MIFRLFLPLCITNGGLWSGAKISSLVLDSCIITRFSMNFSQTVMSLPVDKSLAYFPALIRKRPADGLALAVTPAGQRTLTVVQELRECPRRACAETSNRCLNPT